MERVNFETKSKEEQGYLLHYVPEVKFMTGWLAQLCVTDVHIVMMLIKMKNMLYVENY